MNSVPFWQHQARFPRHRVAESARLHILVQRQADSSEATEDWQLGDLSRHGIQLHGQVCLPVGERIDICVRDASSGFVLKICATVRWQHAEGDGGWALGCQLATPLSWEEYGELFLNNILETD